MKLINCVVIVLLVFLSACNQNTQQNIDLSGEWKFQIDSLDVGIAEHWYNLDLSETVQLPGSMVENGKGNPVGPNTHWVGNQRNMEWFEDENYKPFLSDEEYLFPYWLIPDKHYYGAAWYQKTVDIPSDWKEQNIELYLERCHWETQVWVDGQKVGLQNSLGTAHQYDLTKYLSPGKHKISVCVDNRIKDLDVGPDSHSVSDHTQSNWNGIVGEIKLVKRAKLSISNLQVFPDIANKKVRVEIELKDIAETKGETIIRVEAVSAGNEEEVRVNPVEMKIENRSGKIVIDYPMGDAVRLWDEFDPNLYKLTVEVQSGSAKDEQEVHFGMREIKADGTRFAVNGRPVFLRGTLECAIFPRTGYPPTDVESWKRIITICRAHGLNHIRFHSWCPPEAAFTAADELGFYYQVECSSWANSTSRLGDGLPVDKWLYEESVRMIKAYGNHPSFCLMAYGNEPAGKNQKQFLADFVTLWKTKDSRRVYTGGAGWPAIEQNDYHNLPQPRIQAWGEGLRSIINAQPPRNDYDWQNRLGKNDRPVVSHEIGQWCVYPNLKESEKYDGVLKAKNFELFRRSLNAHQMGHLADSFLLASGKLQALCYKADIEAALRTPGFGGFQLLDLHDFPGQGTALVGVLDPFWEEKGYITPEEYSRFCNETVPLARLPKRIFKSNETISAEIEVAHFGPKELAGVTPHWKIADQLGTVVREGNLATTNLNWGNGIKLGFVETTIPTEKAKQFTLEVEIAGFINSWDIWVYPSEQPKLQEEILVVQELNKKAITTLKNGGKVLLTARIGSVKNGKGGEVGIGFSSIFWNTAWTGGQKPHTLGILCDPNHPALADFPTEFHSNWQWWDAMSHSNAINVEVFSNPVQPILRVIDDWVTNRQLALIFEAKVGKGKLMVTGIDLVDNLKNRPEAQQLLYSLENYMTGEKFNPLTQLSENEIREIFE
ncbi:beta-glucuronidase [Prolixibacteraceae bacterium Z1-6]|uniref:beta-galactosidase n=1 Tax=Draconibacterium aestuarii TaxID=2998507 RepID=A0A9X3F7A8_9BACT|nr:beta-glucuronidase [Prolixibacteraceae bacterium Z1-6]